MAGVRPVEQGGAYQADMRGTGRGRAEADPGGAAGGGGIWRAHDASKTIRLVILDAGTVGVHAGHNSTSVERGGTMERTTCCVVGGGHCRSNATVERPAQAREARLCGSVPTAD